MKPSATLIHKPKTSEELLDFVLGVYMGSENLEVGLRMTQLIHHNGTAMRQYKKIVV